MNPAELYTITPEQILQYQCQPDLISFYESKLHDDYEISQSVRNTSLRFWLNNLSTDFKRHWHTTIELILPLEGQYKVVVCNQTYILEEGDIFLIPSGIPHEIYSVPKGLRFVFLFEMEPFLGFRDFSHIRALLNEPIHITYDTFPSLYPEAIALIKEAANEYWRRDRSYKELFVYSILLKLLASYGNAMLQTDAKKPGARMDLAIRLNYVFQFVEQHLSENIQLEDAARQANFSIYHFSRVFKDCTGQTFTEYLRRIRIKAARQLLLQPETSISWIAHECGFSSLSTFNRVFRMETGNTPSEYRALQSSKILSRSDHDDT